MKLRDEGNPQAGERWCKKRNKKQIRVDDEHVLKCCSDTQ